METKHFRVVGGDRRQRALASALKEDGHEVHTFALAMEGDTLAGVEHDDCVILPLPVMKGGLLYTPLEAVPYDLREILDRMKRGQLLLAGMAGEELKTMAAERGLLLLDYFAREELTIRNAVPTAEGAIRMAMELLPITIHGARILILGFGRVGKALALRLKGLGALVWTAARSPAQRAEAECEGLNAADLSRLPHLLPTFDLVINTVPAPLLGRGELSAVGSEVPVIDLASAPGGVDLDAASALGVKVLTAPGLPGKEAPLTAARYIRDTVYQMMEELGV